jgi:hypothetical protein
MIVHATNGDRTVFYNLGTFLQDFKVSHLIKKCLAVHRCETPNRSYYVVFRTRHMQKPAEYFEVHRDIPLITGVLTSP